MCQTPVANPVDRTHVNPDPPWFDSVDPVLEIFPLAQISASGFRLPLTVRLPVVVAFPLHWSEPTVANPVQAIDPTVANPVQANAPIVYVAVVLSASPRYAEALVTKRGAVQTRP